MYVSPFQYYYTSAAAIYVSLLLLYMCRCYVCVPDARALRPAPPPTHTSISDSHYALYVSHTAIYVSHTNLCVVYEGAARALHAFL